MDFALIKTSISSSVQHMHVHVLLSIALTFVGSAFSSSYYILFVMLSLLPLYIPA